MPGFWHLQDYNNHRLPCVQLVTKAKVVRELGGVYDDFGDYVFPSGVPEPAEPRLQAAEPVELMPDEDLPF